MQLSTLRTRVENNINRDDITSTSVDQWINDIQRFICRNGNFYFMVDSHTATTADGTRSYSLPTGTSGLRFKEEISCELLDGTDTRIPLKRIYKKDAEYRHTDYDYTGRPRDYSIQGGNMYLYPTPDGNDGDNWVIDFEYHGYLGALVDGTDTNNLLDDAPEVVEAGATALGFRYTRQEDKARSWWGSFQAGFDALRVEQLGREHGNIEDGMRPRRGSGAGQRGKRPIDLDAFYE